MVRGYENRLQTVEAEYRDKAQIVRGWGAIVGGCWSPEHGTLVVMQVYSNNGFLSFGEKQDKESVVTGFVKFEGEKVFGGEVVGIGGEYSKRYALVLWYVGFIQDYWMLDNDRNWQW